jgi:hypothetical protein
MNTHIYIGLLLSIHTALFCQQDLVFNTRIIVQDTMGNTDTLLVGLAPGITSGINQQLGEIPDMSPFDSILDVRGGVFLNDPSKDSLILTNRLISVAEEPALYSGQTCYRLAERMFLFIRAKHQPVTIRWEKNEWANECTAASWITTEPLSETVTGWWTIQEEASYRCMAQDSQVVWSLPYNLANGSETWQTSGWYTVHPIADGTLDTISCIQIVPRYRLFFDTPCRISGIENEESHQVSVTIVPNPATDVIRIDALQTIRHVWIFNGGSWNLILEDNALPNEINVSHLPAGFYLVKVAFEDGNYSINRFVKM